MTTQAEVHKKAQALLDAARKLPDVESQPGGIFGRGAREYLGVFLSPHPLRVAVEAALLHVVYVYEPPIPPEQWEPQRVPRPYDDTDPAEPWAWLGRLQPIVNWLYKYNPKPDQHGLEDYQVDGDILDALDAVREAVEEVLNA